jgi:uncharacterized protein (TIGR00375 family)
MKVNLDLHIHSKYSAAVSRDMDLPEIAKGASIKGVKIVGTGDCLFPRWLDEIKRLPFSDGLFRLDDTYFALTVEVEDAHRVHHLILVPGVSEAEDMRERFYPKSSTIETDGRPKLRMEGAEIADLVLDAGCMIGPSHAFTPWTGLYAHYRSLSECYGEHADDIRYIELGLSADTDYADRIAELAKRTFMSNSDAHSPRSNKLAREFNQMELKNLSFKEIVMAINRVEGRQPTLNVGFYPEEGKYNRTACTSCYAQYSAARMKELRGRCAKCGGIIKLGVKDRVESLANYREPVHPSHRPRYLHLIPLSEIIARAIGNKSPYTSGVMKRWNEIVSGRTEIEVLVETDLAEIKAEPRIVWAIEAFRKGNVVVRPGGGGKYGEVLLPEDRSQDDVDPLPKSKSQRSLMEF